MADPRWGIVATVKAPTEDLLRFAAYHLDLGAHRVYLFLDEANPPAHAHLKAHPKVRFQVCDDTYWRKAGQKRPRKHQVRQAVNATRCYARAELDWIAHIDVDEFLWAPRPVGTVLSGLPQSVRCARVRPLESLDGDGTAFKACPVDPAQRDLAAHAIYPTYGKLVKGGFLSHVQGKLFVRTGQDGLTLRIHNVYLDGAENPGQVELDEIDLCHVHARDWESWLAHFRFRHERGSYRSDLAPNRRRDQGGITLHELFAQIEAEDGLSGLRRFYDELCRDTPELRARLNAQGLLQLRELDPDRAIGKHFPQF